MRLLYWWTSLEHGKQQGLTFCMFVWGFTGGSAVKNPPAMQEIWVWSLGWEDPRRRAWQPIPLFLPGECHGQRSLTGYGSWSHKELDTTEATEHACMHFSAIKKNETLPFAANMDGPRDYHTKWNKSEKDKYHTTIACIWNLKYDTNEPIYETEIDSYA